MRKLLSRKELFLWRKDNPMPIVAATIRPDGKFVTPHDYERARKIIEQEIKQC